MFLKALAEPGGKFQSNKERALSRSWGPAGVGPRSTPQPHQEALRFPESGSLSIAHRGQTDLPDISPHALRSLAEAADPMVLCTHTSSTLLPGADRPSQLAVLPSPETLPPSLSPSRFPTRPTLRTVSAHSYPSSNHSAEDPPHDSHGCLCTSIMTLTSLP